MASEGERQSDPTEPLVAVSCLQTDSTHQAPPTPGIGVWGRGRACWEVVRAVTVEPVLFCFIASWALQTSITTNLLLSKVCREQGYEEVICGNLSSYVEIQAAVQRRVSTINLYTDLIKNLPGIFFVLFLGSWSDRHGRKICLLIPLFGGAIATFILMINAYWMSLSSLHILVASVPRALTGDSTTLKMACYCYLSDVSTVKSRTTRIALLNGSYYVASLAGFLASDILFYRTGYLGVYGVGGLLFLVATAYAIIRIKDTRGRYSDYNLQSKGRLRNKCSDLFDMGNIREVFMTMAKQRPNKGRLKMLLLMTSICILAVNYGNSQFDYLYSQRMLGWDYHQFAQLMIISSLLEYAVNSALMPMLSYCLRVEDVVLGLVGCSMSVTAYIIRSVASVDSLLYLSYAVSSVGGIPLLVGRSIISKCVPVDELGRIFSVLGSCEAVTPLFLSSVYTFIYNATILAFPGTMYLVTAVFYLLTAIVYVWLFLTNKHLSSTAPDVTERSSSREELLESEIPGYNTFA